MADPFAPASSGGSKQRFQEFLTSGTFKPSAGLLAAGGVVEVLLVGGGGGGGSGYGGNGGGGGGGGAVFKKYLTVTGPVTVTIASSVAGSLGATTAAGGTGNTSSFGALLSAPGVAVAAREGTTDRLDTTAVARDLQSVMAKVAGVVGQVVHLWDQPTQAQTTVCI